MTEFKAKKCPLNHFINCIGWDCAFYNETNDIEVADNPPDEFTFCSINYLPIIFFELHELRKGRK